MYKSSWRLDKPFEILNNGKLSSRFETRTTQTSNNVNWVDCTHHWSISIGQFSYKIHILLAGYPVRYVLMIVDADPNSLVQIFVVSIQVLVHCQLMLQSKILQTGFHFHLEVLQGDSLQTEFSTWQMPRWYRPGYPRGRESNGEYNWD